MYTDDTEDDLLGLNPTKRVHSSMYRDMRTNLPREVMGFTDFPFDDSFPNSFDSRQFPCHQEVLRYLEAYAEHFNVMEFIRFNALVQSAEPLHTEEFNDSKSELKWKVTSVDMNGVRTTEIYDAVAVCNGHYKEPFIPVWPGQSDFQGIQIHSHNYRTPEGHDGQNVVVVGASYSGTDIAAEISKSNTTATVYLSSRNYKSKETATKNNVVLQPGVANGPILVGNVVSFGPGKRVTFEGGTVIENVDTVLYCTGYIYKLPFLENSKAYPGIEDNCIQKLYQHVFYPEYAPTLSFIGIPFKVSQFPCMELQSKWVARCLRLRTEFLPTVDEMKCKVEAFHADLDAEGVPNRSRHCLRGDMIHEYLQFLVNMIEPGKIWPAWRTALHRAIAASRDKYGVLGYRDNPPVGVDQELHDAHKEIAAVQAQLKHSSPPAPVDF